ncbi:hypothetical protein [Komagataeibacter xylinus]|uniref:hypothetical protein n=1 Tax=Komagataeibacter xylinus TaxID=28448 RepID=UPI00280B63AA|nr:hypothetical protein [Komagataeibacter xylinus]
MTHTLNNPGGDPEPLELIMQGPHRVLVRHRKEIVAMEAVVWQRLVDSGRVVEVGNG